MKLVRVGYDPETGTFHLLGLVIHLGQAFLIAYDLLNAYTQLALQLLDLRLGFGYLVDLGQVRVLHHQFIGGLLGGGFDVVFGFVLSVVDLLYFLLQFLNQSVCVAFGVALVSAYAVADVVIVVHDPPDPVAGPELLPLVDLGAQGLDLGGHLGKRGVLSRRRPPCRGRSGPGCWCRWGSRWSTVSRSGT